MLVKLARINKADPKPPRWYVLKGMSHPPMGERLAVIPNVDSVKKEKCRRAPARPGTSPALHTPAPYPFARLPIILATRVIAFARLPAPVSPFGSTADARCTIAAPEPSPRRTLSSPRLVSAMTLSWSSARHFS